MIKNKFLIFLIFFLIFCSTTNCVVTPSSGQREISLMSEEDEKAIGKTEHPKIIKQFGGVYQNNALQNYIDSNPGSDITTWTGNTNRNRANENLWNDWYYFAGLTLSYKIYTKPKVCQY